MNLRIKQIFIFLGTHNSLTSAHTFLMRGVKCNNTNCSNIDLRWTHTCEFKPRHTVRLREYEYEFTVWNFTAKVLKFLDKVSQQKSQLLKTAIRTIEAICNRFKTGAVRSEWRLLVFLLQLRQMCCFRLNCVVFTHATLPSTRQQNAV